VLHHLVHGRLNKQIAHDLDVSLTTVKAHVSAILQSSACSAAPRR
jgi:DNA-binding NarL/FixJ family response regulator